MIDYLLLRWNRLLARLKMFTRGVNTRTREASNELRQNWRSIYPEIRDSYVMEVMQSPWTVLIDFANLVPGDVIRLSVEVELYHQGESRWRLLEVHVLGVQSSPTRSNQEALPTHLLHNGVNIGNQRLAFIECPEGPWRCRLMYTQLSGLSRPTRYMLVPRPKQNARVRDLLGFAPQPESMPTSNGYHDPAVEETRPLVVT